MDLGSQSEDTDHHSREAMQEELKATGHIASSVVKVREIDAAVQLSVNFLFSVGP